TGAIHVAALHVTVAGLIDVDPIAADAGITCAPPPPAPTGTDGIETGAETGVDCGGSTCAHCANGGGCKVNADCQSQDCVSGLCVAPPPPAPTCTDSIK